jgi:predicted small lipoprotein YifL
MYCEDPHSYKYSMCVLQKPARYQSRRNQRMKVIVLIVMMITICSCGIKGKVSCNVNDINTAITDCKQQPQFGISKEF